MIRHLTTFRKIVSGVFLLGFLTLSLASAGRWPQPVAPDLLMNLDPLVGVTTALATGVLYAGLWLSVLVLVITVLFGRLFCSWVCPLGALQDTAGLFPKDTKLSKLRRRNSYRAIYGLKYAILVALVTLAAMGPVQAGLLDPLALFLRTIVGFVLPMAQTTGLPLGQASRIGAGAVLSGLLLLIILVATRWIPRAWCRTACPLGALLGVAARWAPFQIRRDPDKCTNCGKCTAVCNGAADPDGELRPSECVLCFNCIAACPEDALTYGLPNRHQLQSKESPDVSKRSMIAALGAGVVAYPLLRSGAGAINLPDKDLIRPPGSLPEKDFLSRCVKCAVCVEVCPTGGLQPAVGQGGLEALWTPVLIPRIGYCEANCTECGQACPTGAIQALSVARRTGTDGKPPVKIGTAFIDRGHCLPWGMDKPCLVCEEVCPVSPKAIVTVEGKTRDGKTILQPQVVPHRCIGCGMCENHCPIAGQPAIRVQSTGESRSRRNRFLLGEGRHRGKSQSE